MELFTERVVGDPKGCNAKGTAGHLSLPGIDRSFRGQKPLIPIKWTS
jgi:hypothetical protein